MAMQHWFANFTTKAKWNDKSKMVNVKDKVKSKGKVKAKDKECQSTN